MLGRSLELIPVDGGGDPERIAAEVGQLVDNGRVDAVAGWHISAVRERLAPRIAHRVPYVYTTPYEGGERTPGVLVTGETPQNQLEPAMRWMARELGVVRWYVIGNDYVWPRRSASAARAWAARSGVRIREERYVPLGSKNFAPVIDAIGHTDAQAVLVLLVGQDVAHFNRAFAAAGMDSSVLRLGTLLDENSLLASGSRQTRNLYAASAYFDGMVTGSSLDFVGRYAECFGVSGPVPTSFGESCYEGLMLFAELVGRAGSVRRGDVLEVAEGVLVEGPRGPVRLRGAHAVQDVYLARADGLDFDVVDRLDPEPGG